MADGDYCPDRGDVIWLDFDPARGHEQAGHRSPLVLTPRRYNERSQLCTVCPISSRAARYPTDVALPQGAPVDGTILTNHLRSVCWTGRRSRRSGTLPPQVVADVCDRVAVLLGID